MSYQRTTKPQPHEPRNNSGHHRAGRGPSNHLHSLNHSLGNHAVQRLIQSPYIQAKLQVSTPNDPLEQEADATADKVMRMTDDDVTPSNVAATNLSSLPADQKTVATKSKSKSRTVPVAVREDDKECEDCGHKHVQRACSHCDEDEPVQRKCAECEDEQKVDRKEAGASIGPTSVAARSIDGMKGGGSPLPPASRAFFEPRFGADFSKVRVHTDSRANETAKSINAKAFTVGPNIAFGSGHYALESDSGRRLLAHELTHVVQQSSSTPRVDRDDDDTSQTPKTPKQLLEDRLQDYYFDPDDQNLTSKDKAEARRLALLLQDEINFHDAPGYTDQIKSQYPDLQQYVADTINDIHSVSPSETKTMDKLIVDRNLSIATADFAWHPFFSDNVAAFPESYLKVIVPLLQPPFDEGAHSISESERAKKQVESTRNNLPDFFFEEGLPVSYRRSVDLSDYHLIKSKNLRSAANRFLARRPRYESDFEFLIEPEETNLHRGLLSSYDSAWTGNAINLFTTVIYATWFEHFNNIKSSINDGSLDSIDVVALKAFKEKYPKGLTSLDEFVEFSSSSSGGSIFDLKFNAFDFFDLARVIALGSSANKTSELVDSEYKFFNYQLSAADQKVQNLSEIERLGKALYWSVKKGFAVEGIMNVVDNFGKLLRDILEEKIEKSVFKRLVTFVASLHPLGRLAVLAYNIYTTVQDIKDALDILSLVHLVVSTIDEAKSATSIVQVQRSAAHLAEIYEQVIPLIAQKISSALAKKLMKGSEPKSAADDPKQQGQKSAGAADDPKQQGQKPGAAADDPKQVKKPAAATPHHDPKKTLQETAKIDTVDQLIREPRYLTTELDAAAHGTVKKSSHPDYEIEVTLPNKHTWRRNSKGMWCRFTHESCVLSPKDLPDEMRKQLEELDKGAEGYKEAKGDEDRISKEDLDELSKTTSDNPPGYKKPKARTSLGTFVHSRDYTRFCAWLETKPGQEWLATKNLTRADLALANMPTGKIEREFTIPGLPNKPRVDVVDWDNATVHEIKPAGSERLGFVEAQQYAKYMNDNYKRSDGRLWVAGRTITYDGARILKLFTDFGYFKPE